MKMYLPFGDWSGDGHGRCTKILIDAPSMETLLNAQKKIKAKYGEDFFNQMADEYEESYFGESVWQALIDANYPVENFIEKEGCNDWRGIKDLSQVLTIDSSPCLSIDFVIDAFIWLLNSYGASIRSLDEEEDIPTICNWTCHGFETVGYGCFDI